MLAFSLVANAQTKKNKFINGESNYNSWSLSAYVGPSSIYTGNLLTDASGFKFGIDAQLGVTKWFNHSFGVEGLLQLGKTKQTKGIPNTKGNTEYIGFALNGVVNLNSIFRRADLAGPRKWNVYAYTGLGLMDFTSEVTNTLTNTTTEYKNDDLARSLYVQTGAILSRKINNNFDISLRANFLLSGKDLFDGVPSTSFAASEERLITGSIGVTYHFGNKEKLVWSDPLEFRLKNVLSELEALKDNKQVLDVNDDDKDGVINEFDKEPNTLVNAIVDGAGRALDTDNDGVANGIDKCPSAKGEISNGGCPTKKTQEKDLEKLNFELKSIKFDKDKAVIKAQYFSILDNAVSVMKKYSKEKFMITGYTDCRGDVSLNQGLSEKRANAVKLYLLDKGIAVSQIFSYGKGENAPISSCVTCSSCSKDELYENRRVEIKVLN
jgi:OOP family OmpA-OmpF porin